MPKYERVVIDAVTVINFAAVGKLDLLCELYRGKLYITESVVLESKKIPMFSTGSDQWTSLDVGNIPAELRQGFMDNHATLSQDITVSIEEKGKRWLLTDREKRYYVSRDGRKLRVYKEIEMRDWIENGKIKEAIFDYDIEIQRELPDVLKDGEISCIIYAVKANCAIATDDRSARELLRNKYKDIELTGTIGLLYELVQEGFITAQYGKELFREMKEKGFRYKGDITFGT